MNKKIADKLKRIKLLALDVDGILTNGKIVLDEKGREIKVFDVQDGFGIVIFRKMGLKTAIISARSAKPVEFRAKDLKIDRVYQDAYPKIHAYEQLLKDLKLRDDEICFMGDDLPDMCVLKRVGFAASVPNAVEEVKKCADYVTKKRGGEGAVREVIELILKAQGKWERIIKSFSFREWEGAIK